MARYQNRKYSKLDFSSSKSETKTETKSETKCSVIIKLTIETISIIVSILKIRSF